MASETLLSDLCSICNTNKSKYRCPGCAARTCSLPCYKRHQQWAQCTGKRDPTRYVRKAQLATPAGIDHDFNFLTGIERGLERAEKDVGGRLLGVPDSGARAVSQRGKVTNERLAAAGVAVIRAPKGLSRETENKTYRNSKGNIHWTIEWIHPDRSRLISGLSEKLPLLEAYRHDIGQPLPRPNKKRKRVLEAPTSIRQDPNIKQEANALTLPSSENGRPGVAASGKEAEPPSPRQASPILDSTLHQPASIASEAKPDAEMASTTCPSPDVHEPASESLLPEYHFFLLRPRTGTTHHVLIPLSPYTTLHECLRGRTVLEFPTIYVFTGSPPQLPEDFVLEENYMKQAAEDEKELAELMKNVDPQALQAIRTQSGHDGASEELDSKRILDVLKQDLGTAI